MTLSLELPSSTFLTITKSVSSTVLRPPTPSTLMLLTRLLRVKASLSQAGNGASAKTALTSTAPLLLTLMWLPTTTWLSLSTTLQVCLSMKSRSRFLTTNSPLRSLTAAHGPLQPQVLSVTPSRLSFTLTRLWPTATCSFSKLFWLAKLHSLNWLTMRPLTLRLTLAHRLLAWQSKATSSHWHSQVSVQIKSPILIWRTRPLKKPTPSASAWNTGKNSKKMSQPSQDLILRRTVPTSSDPPTTNSNRTLTRMLSLSKLKYAMPSSNSSSSLLVPLPQTKLKAMLSCLSVLSKT